MYPSRTDGRYGVFVYKLVRALRQRGVSTRARAVISGMPSGIIAKFVSYVLLYSRILIVGATAQYDALIAHYPPHVIVPSWLVARIRRKRLVVAFHGSDLMNPRGKAWISHLNTFALRAADQVVCPSHFLRQHALSSSRRSPNTVVVFPSCGVNRKLFAPSTPREKRRELGFADEHFVVGFVSTETPAKGIPEFLEACHLLMRKDTLIRVLIVGGGPAHERVRQFARQPAFSGRVVALGEVPHFGLPSYYAALDCLVFPTKLQESLGLVPLEALSVGVPVVAPRTGAIPEYLREGVNGAFLDIVEPYAIARKVEMIRAAAPWDRVRVSRSVEHYNAERVLDEFLERLVTP